MICDICLNFAGLKLKGVAMLQLAQRDARIAALEEICRHRDSSATPAKQVRLSPHPESAPTAILLQAAAVPAYLHVVPAHASPNADTSHNADII